MKKTSLVIAVVATFLLLTLSPQPTYAFSLEDITNLFTPSPQQVLQKSIDKANSLKSVHTDFDSKMSMHINNPDVEGQTINQDGKFSGDFDSDLEGKQVQGHLSTNMGSNAFDMNMVLLKDGKMFMKVPMVSSDWVETSVQQLRDEKILVSDPQSLDFKTQTMPFLQSIDQKSVTKVADEDLDGVKVIHLKANVDSSKLVDQLKKVMSDPGIAEAYKNSIVALDLWVDKNSNDIIKTQANINKIDITKLYPELNDTKGSMDMAMNLKYSKFNEKFNISKPMGKAVKYGQPMSQPETTTDSSF